VDVLAPDVQRSVGIDLGELLEHGLDLVSGRLCGGSTMLGPGERSEIAKQLLASPVVLALR
jgi:hypothetical protein